MARGLNRVLLIGNLGRDPELSYLPSGLAVARFTLATTERRRRADNEWEDVTDWHRVVLFGRQAEVAGQFLSKGQQVFIEGRIRYNTYEREGVKRTTTEIIASNLMLLGKKEEVAEVPEDVIGAPEAPGEIPPPIAEEEEDLPF